MSRRRKNQSVRELISESRRLWERYYARPTQTNLRTYIAHHGQMKERQSSHPSKMLGKELAAVAGVLREAMSERGMIKTPRARRKVAKRPRGRRTSGLRVPNPTVPKFERVQKETSAIPEMLRRAVMADVAHAWLEAVGLDNLVENTRRGIYNGRSASYLLGRVITEGDLPTSSRYDDYLPWLGKVLRKRAKRAARITGAVQAKGKRGVGSMDESLRYLDDDDLDHIAAKEWREASWIYEGAEGDARYSQLPIWERIEPRQRFRAIVDWAEAKNIDLGELNRMSLADIIEQADAYGDERAGRPMLEGEVVYEFDDGWTVQRLTTQEQLAHEGDIMQNCIGDEAVGCYTMEGIGRTGIEIYSLRDAKGRPHVSMAFDGDAMVEFKGKQNSPPRKPEYIKKAIEFRYELQPGEISGIFDERDWREFEPHIGTYLMSWLASLPEGAVYHVFRAPNGELVAAIDDLMEEHLHFLFGHIGAAHGLEDGPDLEREILAKHRGELNETIEEGFWDGLQGGGRIYSIGLEALWPLIVDGKATLEEIPDASGDEMLAQVVTILKPGRK